MPAQSRALTTHRTKRVAHGRADIIVDAVELWPRTDSQDCALSEDTARCVYTVSVTRAEADASPRGLWHVAVLATAGDGDTTLDTKAADFTVR